MSYSSKSKYSGTFMSSAYVLLRQCCKMPSALGSHHALAGIVYSTSHMLIAWVLIAWDTLKLVAPLNCTGFLPLFLLLTIYLQKSPHQFFQFLEFLKWSQFLQIFCWSLAHYKEFQRLPAILLHELRGVFLTLASKLLKNHAQLAEEILHITVQTFWKIFFFPWSRDLSLSLTESILMIFCFLTGFWKYPVLLKGDLIPASSPIPGFLAQRQLSQGYSKHGRWWVSLYLPQRFDTCICQVYT